MKPRSIEAEIAASLDAEEILLPYLPELLAAVPVLGASRGAILDVLRKQGVGHGHRVLDLACGKGAVALALAWELGCAVRGVDLFTPFIKEAIARADELGIGERCTFEVGDMRDRLDADDDHDVVVYASVGVLGPLDQCVALLRRATRHGGYIVIDDGYVVDHGLTRRPGYEHYAGDLESRRLLTSSGDRIVAEVIRPAAESKAEHKQTTEAIRRSAVKLAREHPEDRDLILSYVKRQEEECEALEQGFQSAVWLLKKSG